MAEEVVFTTSHANGMDSTANSKAADFVRREDKYKAIDGYCARRVTKGATKPLFNKMVLVVIDALRHDFIPSIDDKRSVQKGRNSGAKHRMPFTETIMQTNGVGLVSISATPTVTMPRIKAMISGTLPSFMDFILNLSAYRFNGENLVENAFKANKRVVFFGDETWIQLLPQHLFAKYNGTSSFFATDYTEVDTNVTYCVDRELKRLKEWDVMIMHYLGVDHIGHSHGGYHSRLMPKKLLEMDSVIKSIYTSVSAPDVSEPYLVVITGDHGMTDIGNHGGNTPEETDTALIFLSTNQTKVSANYDSFGHKAERVLQVDISSTLSALLGLPLPNKSLGKVMLNVLNALHMRKDEQMCHMFANALQIIRNHCRNARQPMASLVDPFSTLEDNTTIQVLAGHKYNQNHSQSLRFGKQQCLLISGLVWVYLYRSDYGTVSSFKLPAFLYVDRNIRAKIVFFHVYLIII
ncbi:unnamed protein product, partial [Oppiella nova]